MQNNHEDDVEEDKKQSSNIDNEGENNYNYYYESKTKEKYLINDNENMINDEKFQTPLKKEASGGLLNEMLDVLEEENSDKKGRLKSSKKKQDNLEENKI